jgi:hypothetical protein
MNKGTWLVEDGKRVPARAVFDEKTGRFLRHEVIEDKKPAPKKDK